MKEAFLQQALFQDDILPRIYADGEALIMRRVADWQLQNPGPRHPAKWTNATFYRGLAALARMDNTDTYWTALKAIGDQLAWQPENHSYHADDHGVGFFFLEAFEHFRDPVLLQGIKDRFDYVLAHRATAPLTEGKQEDNKRWWWCDSLFMSPPVLVKLSQVTGDPKYLNFMNEEFWVTADFLYDQDEHLFYRDDRFFEMREENGKKVFWSRGNGWVIAGLAGLLNHLPNDFPDRPRYEKLFCEIAARLVELQPEDGVWRASLLHPDRLPAPETSGTSFHCYGLAWGINQGLLDEARFLPALKKAWNGLVHCVHANGMLGNVQQIGGRPQPVTPEQTQEYGVGGFLLAAAEVHQWTMRNSAPVRTVKTHNPLPQFRDSVTVSVPWSEVTALAGVDADSIGVFDLSTKRFLVTQALDTDGDGQPDELLFQMSFAPGEKRDVWIMKRPDGIPAPQTDHVAYGRFVPERKEDFSWENDKGGHRMYGRALEPDLASTGIDVWSKCVPYSMINSWYERRKYHKDHGEGGDFYSIGRTLGCGGSAPFKEGVLYYPRHFLSYNVLANGPIRVLFELNYETWDFDGLPVAETKRISLDKGSYLSRIESHMQSDSLDLPLAFGVMRSKKGSDDKSISWGEGWISYWMKADGENGMLGTAVVTADPASTRSFHILDDHYLFIKNQPVGEPMIWYAGSCWDKTPPMTSFDDWQKYVQDFARGLKNPIHVTIS